MFWKRKETKESGAKLSGPKGIPELVGRHMVVAEKKDPDWVWHLKCVVRQVGKKEFYCRVFDGVKALHAGVKVKDWTSLDEHPELILWEGYFNKETIVARRDRFVEPSSSAN